MIITDERISRPERSTGDPSSRGLSRCRQPVKGIAQGSVPFSRGFSCGHVVEFTLAGQPSWKTGPTSDRSIIDHPVTTH